ncbi:mRNA interferase RelE/StbE [Pseudarcicella hirudinis]|uniref:mRNA interferase RelE/StbE n=1 Tax=Pseudarcicella hirudinis TaxID=1079859 RepID=A0A1I5MJ29_9BACT|nr:type II toxin-antitoxin system RelE/ParE family toxin [Pseudarcicella hirudinis]SFP09648.1 mRNA interferase RelE/StbE [Pseudarcicella hirudinis]
MIVNVSKGFIKELKKCPKQIQKGVIEILEELEKVDSVMDIKNVKKLNGYDTFYRIRIGSYRIGLEIEDGVIKIVWILTILSRGDIYKKFPPK